MALSYFGSASSPVDNSNEDNAVAVTPPASMVAGDLVIVEAGENTSGRTLAVGVTGGQTWYSGGLSNAGVGSWAVFWCVFNGTWAANPTFPISSGGTTNCFSTIMHVYRGNGSGYTWQPDVVYDVDAYTATSPTRPGVTTVGADVIVQAGWSATQALTWGALSGAGWTVTGTAQYRNTASTDQTATYAHYIGTTPSESTGGVTKTANTSHTGQMWIMAWANVETKAARAIHHYKLRRAA